MTEQGARSSTWATAGTKARERARLGDRHDRRVHVRRVLGLGRGSRHKMLPAITIVIAYLPALIFAGVSAILTVDPIVEDDLITYGEYTFFIRRALALFAAVVAPEALCPDRRTGMLGLYLAGPLDVTATSQQSGRRSSP